jgi:serine/threonine protein kinase
VERQRLGQGFSGRATSWDSAQRGLQPWSIPLAISAGTRLGPYQIVAALGSGGMGDVYRAYDTKLRRTVAIKVLAGGADEASRARLLREARAASSLNHPNICTVHEIHETGDRAFIVMENVDGQRLSDLIPADGLSVDAFVRYASQLADALAYAHEHGVVHRDLKASNVVVNRDGRAKMLDFGLAVREPTAGLDEVTRSQTPFANPGEIAGTLGYMAPEVLKGRPGDALSDVWSLGVLFHRMLAGAPPFKGETGFDLTAAILRDPPSALPSRVPAGLRTVVARCLAKEPSHRYQRANEICAAIEMISAGVREDPTNSQPPAPDVTSSAVAARPSRVPRRWRSARRFALATAVGLLLLLVWTILASIPDRLRGHGILIRVGGRPENLAAIVYAYPRKPIRPGMDVELLVNTVRIDDYGLMKGTVERVGEDLVMIEQVATLIGNRQLAEDLFRYATSDGPVVEVAIKLQRSETTRSGYEWSGSGPPYKLDGGMRVLSLIHVGRTSPFLYYVEPFLKKLILRR